MVCHMDHAPQATAVELVQYPSTPVALEPGPQPMLTSARSCMALSTFLIARRSSSTPSDRGRQDSMSMLCNSVLRAVYTVSTKGGHVNTSVKT